jgi:hypothetical protein
VGLEVGALDCLRGKGLFVGLKVGASVGDWVFLRII